MCFSQTTFQITADQLRTANLIFVEHERLSQEVPLLYDEIANLKHIDSLRVNTDSIQNLQIANLTSNVQDLNSTIIKQKRQIKLRNYSLTGCSILIICLLIL